MWSIPSKSDLTFVVLLPVLFQGTGLCRNSITIRPTDVKRPILLREMPKSPTRVLSVVQTAVIVASIISFVGATFDK